MVVYGEVALRCLCLWAKRRCDVGISKTTSKADNLDNVQLRETSFVLPAFSIFPVHTHILFGLGSLDDSCMVFQVMLLR